MPDNIKLESKTYAILHKQICDNYSECPAKIACEEASQREGRQPAIYIDENHKIEINRDNCTGCSLCVMRCGLFRVVTPIQEIDEQREFDRDPRNKMNFTVERFGCDIINRDSYLLKDLFEVQTYITESQNEKVNILEFVDESHVMCPFQAIDVDYIKKIFPILDKYRKFVIKSTDKDTFTEIINSFKIRQFPAIALLFGGHMLGSPIMNEYRIRNESDRIEIQLRLAQDFSDRLERKTKK